MAQLSEVENVKGSVRMRVATSAYAVIVMYLSFMMWDRMLSLIIGANFQPYGPSVPQGFTVWGHIFNGSIALFGVWIWLKLWGLSGRSEYKWILRFIVTAIALTPAAWIPYTADAAYLVSLGHGSLIPLYLAANVIFVWTAGVVALRLFNSNKWKLVFLVSLFIAFLFIHFAPYAPAFSEFQWT